MIKMAVDKMQDISTIELENKIDFYISIATKKGHYSTKIEKDIIKIIVDKNEELEGNL